MFEFEWDEAKNRSNIIKHGIPFEEAKTVFADPHGRLMHDPDHAHQEDRYVLLGMSHSLRMLVVCHCDRKNDSVIRIISARKATRRERQLYKGELS
ncbi:MAG: BrnT family toxin [Deltaproteobacteria bacterium]|nr:BrnT family toxin [Deltaproteobacteria bacterium]